LADGLEAVVPERARISHSKVEEFLFEKQAWILRNVSKIEEVSKQKKSKSDSLLFLGKEAEIRIVEEDRKTARAFPGEGKLLVKVPFNKKGLAGKAITNFYKKQARKIISKIVVEKADLMGVSFSRVSVRDQSTRWGSCSPKNTLSFSWRLVAAPRAIVEYLVVHELAHLRHRNHSKRFWAEVEKFCPLYKQAEKWLKKNKLVLRARTSF